MTRLERAVEVALTVGLAASCALLVGGLLRSSRSALAWGILLLLLTPVVRVLLVTLGLFLCRDWRFGLVSLFVLLVLSSGIALSGSSGWPRSLPFR